ncbi:MAG: MBL fold metallo-hydrolase [Thermoguttaceae bacterium]|nr:MBL fold metallo-hydrolase [Thermoguttaceae bacterium]MDW8077959.1 MBL fold metallo-hydrolase [Thermoguttaceae bacterium]
MRQCQLGELLFFWDNGIRLRHSGLAVDIPRRQPFGFISHAHSDHIARHELALCTPATGEFYRLRLGNRPVREVPFGQVIQTGNSRLCLFPAGHCLGSAMLWVEAEGQTLLYTGDFRLGESATAERAQVPRADVLIMESTYGLPRYRMPPRSEVVELLRQRVLWACSNDWLPVVVAYSLGKAQEVLALLGPLKLPIYVHKTIYAISEVYKKFGVKLPGYELLHENVRPPAVVIVPPGSAPSLWWPRQWKLAVTGWAIDPATPYRLRVDEALPLTDHADFDGLIGLVELVKPRRVYCLHGPEVFVEHLRARGWDARPLGRPTQYRLF